MGEGGRGLLRYRSEKAVPERRMGSEQTQGKRRLATVALVRALVHCTMCGISATMPHSDVAGASVRSVAE